MMSTAKARIVNIDSSLLLERMADRRVPVIAGFKASRRDNGLQPWDGVVRTPLP